MFQETLGMRLRGAYLTFHRCACAHFEKLDTTADQFVILTILAEEEGLTQREPVARASSDPNTIGEMLGRLERKRLVRRQPHPKDGRLRGVFLTAQGRKTQCRLAESWQDALDDIDVCFQPKELKALTRLLSRVPAAVEKCLATRQVEVA